MLDKLKKISFSKGFKRILSNTGYLFGEKVFNMGLSLGVGIWVARYLGPDKFGLWQYANSLVGLVTAVATLGTTNIVIRDLVDEPEDKEGRILGTTFILILGAGIITAAIITGVGFWLNSEVLTRWLIVIASMNLVLQAFQVFDYWFQSKVLSKYSVYARTTAKLIISLLKIVFILLSLSVVYFALTVVVSGIVRFIVWFYSFEKKQDKKVKRWTFDLQYAKKLLRDSWPLILSGISVAIYMKIDQVMLKSMVNANVVGNYAVAVRLSELWYFIPLTVCSSVFPSIIESKADSIEKYHRRLQYLYDVMAGIAIAIAVPMTFLSGFIINLLFGHEYAMAGGVLAIYIWAGIFVFIGVARSKWLINENLQKFSMLFTFSGAVSNVLLNLWLIPTVGATGAAWATVISYMISAWLTALFFNQTRIAFYMQNKAILKALFIIPAIYSMLKILKEAKPDGKN
ncbi:MAG TPA: flippase [Bacteroidales bacterium]|nr:flippase [Bacteroidales bacterium]